MKFFKTVFVFLLGVIFTTSVTGALAGPALPQHVLDMTLRVAVHEEKTPDGFIYTVVLPAQSSYRIKPAIDMGLQTVEAFAKENSKALLVINAGYFDPVNKKTASFVTLEGKEVLNPKDNERLTQNKGLAPYWSKILNRSEFRIYHCSEKANTSKVFYDIVPHQALDPATCQLWDAVGGGPQLLPTMTAEEEAVIAYNEDKKLIRDPFGISRPNARTAVGITADNSVILMLMAQNPDEPGATGFDFNQMTEALKRLGAVKAMALDGGSSSSMVVNHQSYWAKYNKEGEPVKRPVKSVLMIVPE